MRKTVPIPNCGLGLNLDLLPAELPPGTASAATNVRFRNGFAEAWTGALLAYQLPSASIWARPFTNSSGTVYAVSATTTAAYATVLGGAQTDITRKTDGKVISSITRVGTTATLTTAAAHGLSTGNTVTVYAASPSQYNGTYSITVTGATTFTYTMASDPGASASPVGAYHGSATSNLSTLTGTNRFTGGAFNGNLIINSPTDGLFYWDGNTSNPIRKDPTFCGTSTYNTAKAVIPFKQFLIALGKTENGTSMPQNVAWTDDIDDVGQLPSWTASSTNNAGETNLTEKPGPLVDAVQLGDLLIIYATDCRYAMQYVGGDQVFSFTRLPGDSGVITSGCVAETPAGHCFLSTDGDVLLHTGGYPKSIADGRVRQYILTTRTESSTKRSFVLSNQADSEVWVCIPTTLNYGAHEALVWNWKNDVWGRFILGDGATSAAYSSGNGIWLSGGTECAAVVGLRGGNEYLSLLNGTGAGAWMNVTITTPSVTFQNMPIASRDIKKAINRSRLNADGSGTLTVEHGAANFADTSPTYATSVTYTIGTSDYVSARSTQGRFISLRVTSGTAVGWKLRSVDLDIALGGTR